MPNSILTGLAAGDVDCQYWERRDLGDFHRDNVVLRSLELIYTSAFGAFGCFVAVSVCVCQLATKVSGRSNTCQTWGTWGSHFSSCQLHWRCPFRVHHSRKAVFLFQSLSDFGPCFWRLCACLCPESWWMRTAWTPRLPIIIDHMLPR